ATSSPQGIDSSLDIARYAKQPAMNDAMEWARIVRSFLWPAGVIILAVWLFRGQISAFIKDVGLFKICSTGAEFYRQAPPDATQPPNPPPVPRPVRPPPSPEESRPNLQDPESLQWYA